MNWADRGRDKSGPYDVSLLFSQRASSVPTGESTPLCVPSNIHDEEIWPFVYRKSPDLQCLFPRCDIMQGQTTKEYEPA